AHSGSELARWRRAGTRRRSPGPGRPRRRRLMANALHTRACDLFGVRYPIVQTGMGWVAGARLTAATSAAGGLGILASATMDLTELAAAIESVKERTDHPFG